MKRILIAGAALIALIAAQPTFGADAPIYKGPAPVAAALFNWSGFYVGGHVGGGWGTKDWVALGFGALGSHNISGFLGGGQVGFNYQTGAWVFGVEGDFSWANLKGEHVDAIFGGNNITEVEWLGTITGRIGYALDRTLLYVKGGGAWVRDKYTITAGGVFFAGANATKGGWTVGTGLEHTFAPNWSAKIEYNYFDFGKDTVTFVPGAFLREVDQHIHAVKVGINYRFGMY